MKKVLAALLMLVMLVILAASAMAAGPEIYVGGVGMYSGDYLANNTTTTTNSEPSVGYAYYKDGKLTLNNYVYNGIGHAKALVYVPNASDTDIVLLGTNSITTNADASYVNYGILSQDGSITISGTGILDIKTKGGGVSTNEISVSGGTLKVDVGEEGIRAKGDISITGGELNVTAGGNGIKAENMKIGGGTVVVNSSQYGIWLPFGNASVTGGNVRVASTGEGLGTQAVYGDLNIGSGMAAQASTTHDGTLGEYVADDLNKYKLIVVKAVATVTFDSDGGSAVAEQIMFKGDMATKPADPTRTGYTFKGWTLDGTAYDFNTPVTGSITLKATWEKKVDIWVGGVGMASGDYLANGEATTTTSKPSDGYAYYKDGVLTLHDYSYTGAGYAYNETASAIVYTAKKLELVLEGTNTLKAVPKSSDQNAYGVYTSGVSADLTIKENGPGSLTVDDAYAAVFCDGSLTIDGGVVIANKAISNGIRAKWGLEINNGEIKIVDAKGYGIDSMRSMSVKGGEVTVTADGVGIQAHLGMFVSGGDVEVTSYNSYGINDGANNTGFAVLSGSLKTTGKDHGACLDGSTLTIKGGYFEAVSTGDSDYAINIKASNFSYDGATVQASIEPDDTLGAYVKENNNQYDRVVVKAPVKYTVTVENGDGSGNYAAGETVTITAPVVSGKVFKEWTSADGVTFDNKNAAATTFTMPEKNVTVTAVYRNLIDTAAVTWTEPVVGATWEKPVLIEPTVTSDQNWMILEFDSESDFATWEDVATKHNTSWDGTFRAGKYYLYDFSVTIPGMFTADVSKTMNGQPHDTRYDTASGYGWIPDKDDFVSIIRVYGPLEAAKYTVTVENGDGSGDYAAGETVTITAPAVSGKVFKEWTSADGVTFADKNAAATTFTMPEKNVTVTAVYNTIISVIDLSGITPPVAGAMPDTSFTISTPGVEYGAEIFWSRYDEANNKLEQQYPDATLVNNTPFRAGIYYKMQAEVWAEEGYIFTPDTVIRYDGVELPVKDDANLKPNFRYPVLAEHRDRTAASIGWAVAEAEPTTYTVTFDSDGGSAVAPQPVTEGGTATEPAEPTKAGYTFKGWTLDGAAYDFDTPVTGDIVLKATWEETPPEMTGAQFTVHKIDDEWTPLAGAEFTLYQGGAVVAVVTTEADGAALFTGLADGLYSLEETDAPEGYAATTDTCAVEIVDGSVSFDANGSDDFEIADELFVYNRRENADLATYTVTFDSDGGSAVAPQTVTEGDKATEPAAPTKAGYTFKGWTLSGAAYDFDTPVTGDITLKAVWEATPGVTFIVTFDANGGEGTMAPQTFADGAAQALTLNAFTRRGYSFTGWNTAADGSGMAYADGAVGVLEDNITLYAQWEQNLYPVVITKVLKGISADNLPEGTAYHFAVIDGNNGDTQESAVITREELIEGKGKASKTIMTAYYGGMRVGEQISSAELSGYTWSAACVVTGDAEHQAMDEVYDVKGFVCSDLIMPETGEAIVTYTNEYIPAGGDLPKTGDDSHLALWLALLGMTGAAMLMLRKKREA